MRKYFLTVILQNLNKELPVIDVAMSLGTVVDSKKLKFQHNDAVAIFHFDSGVNKKDLFVFIQGVLTGVTDTFLLTEVDDNFTISLPQNLMKYFLDLEDGEVYEIEHNSPGQKPNGDFIYKDESGKTHIEYNGFYNLGEEEDFDEDDFGEDILETLYNNIMNPKKPPTLDFLLDKINDKGIESLSSFELKTLKKYSN